MMKRNVGVGVPVIYESEKRFFFQGKCLRCKKIQDFNEKVDQIMVKGKSQKISSDCDINLLFGLEWYKVNSDLAIINILIATIPSLFGAFYSMSLDGFSENADALNENASSFRVLSKNVAPITSHFSVWGYASAAKNTLVS